MAELIKVWYDGACEPVNPGGHGSYGFVIRGGGKLLQTASCYIGHGPEISNNVAEYCGAAAAMEWLLSNGHGLTPVLVHGDNMMSVMQLAGKWRVKRGLYVPYYEHAAALSKRFRNIAFAWIPREKNAEADELSKRALLDRRVEFRIQPQKEGSKT